MKLRYKALFWSMLGALTALMHARADTLVTHVAKVEIALTEINEKGKENRIERLNGELSLDWDSQRCVLNIKKSEYPCTFDRSEDIVNSKGELVMKSLPQISFDSRQVDFMLIALLVSDSYRVPSISQLVFDVSKTRASLLKVPFYECIDCENNGKNLKLANAFYGTVERSLKIEHRDLGKKKLKFTLALKKIEPQSGAYFIIGNDNADQYGQ